MALRAEEERQWLRQWEAAGPALEEQRRNELRGLTDEAALAATDALLSLVTTLTPAPRRRSHSGLVEQQLLFHRHPAR